MPHHPSIPSISLAPPSPSPLYPLHLSILCPPGIPLSPPVSPYVPSLLTLLGCPLPSFPPSTHPLGEKQPRDARDHLSEHVGTPWGTLALSPPFLAV